MVFNCFGMLVAEIVSAPQGIPLITLLIFSLSLYPLGFMLGSSCEACWCDQVCSSGFCYVEMSGSTCWRDIGNAHVVKVEETSTKFSLDGLGVIAKESVSKESVEKYVRYGGQSFTLGVMGRKRYQFAVDSLDSVSISSKGSRYGGAAGEWTHPVGDVVSSSCNPIRTPALIAGGQGAYLLSVSKSQSSTPAYICTLTVGCLAKQGGANFIFGGTSGSTANGKYFYVAVDNQNTGATLNGKIVLTCGSGPMIESAIIDKNWSSPSWNFSGDCIAFLIEGWIVPA